jgi:antitoxin component of RelBE/YafQ-DinJ toxin-antitoxin module
MDAKVTLSFDREVIQKAKALAEAHNISLSRFLEYLLRKAASENYQELEDLPIADWVNEVAEGKAEYLTRPRSRKALKKEFFDSRK